MSFNGVFHKETGVYCGGEKWRDPDHDPATQIVVQLDKPPEDPRTQRWDGTALRDATPEEIAAYDEADKDETVTVELGSPVQAVLSDVLWDLHQRTPGVSTIPEIAAATDKKSYRQALKTLVRVKL